MSLQLEKEIFEKVLDKDFRRWGGGVIEFPPKGPRTEKYTLAT